MARGRYELTFWGGAFVNLPRHRRFHDTAEAAEAEARRVQSEMDERGINRNAHMPIIYDPRGKQLGWRD